MINSILTDAICNLKENKRFFMFFCFFLVLSFSGIIIVDSLIHSTSNKAAEELKITNKNTLVINFYNPIEKERILKHIKIQDVKLSFEKTFHSFVSRSPYVKDINFIHGVDYCFFDNKELIIKNIFEGNVIIVDEYEYSNNKNKILFINGIPFKIIGYKKEKKTDFLNSLGISGFFSNEKYIVPFETAIKLTLNSKVDKIRVTFNDEVDLNKINKVNHILSSNNFHDYEILSSYDAKETVNNVIDRFKLLVNSIYLILNILSFFIISAVCKKNFQLRAIEFALKVIHGINFRTMITLVTIEVVMIVLFSIALSIISSFFSLYFLSIILNISLQLRFYDLSVSFCFLLFVCVISSILHGIQFFKANPIDIIKGKLA